MSARRLQGWEPRETTTFEYDESGRLVSAVTVREPEWDTEQLSMMLAHLGNEESLNVLGFPIEDVFSKNGDFNNKQGTHFYTAGPALVDHSQKAKHEAEEAYRKQYGDLPPYVHFNVSRVERG